MARVDRDAVRRRREQVEERGVGICDLADGMSELYGSLLTTDANAFNARLNALADAVCAADPRSSNQRRADAVGALAAGSDRLTCRCGQPDCAAGAKPAPGPVLIHVIAEQASVDGTGRAPGSVIGTDALIPAELVAELAGSAKLRPLIHPTDAPPEAGYTPSRALADFVRCWDLTCRFPGCDQPAVSSDLDHTIPYGNGGRTHASNLRFLSRFRQCQR